MIQTVSVDGQITYFPLKGLPKFCLLDVPTRTYNYKLQTKYKTYKLKQNKKIKINDDSKCSHMHIEYFSKRLIRLSHFMAISETCYHNNQGSIFIINIKNSICLYISDIYMIISFLKGIYMLQTLKEMYKIK